MLKIILFNFENVGLFVTIKRNLIFNNKKRVYLNKNIIFDRIIKTLKKLYRILASIKLFILHYSSIFFLAFFQVQF